MSTGDIACAGGAVAEQSKCGIAEGAGHILYDPGVQGRGDEGDRGSRLRHRDITGEPTDAKAVTKGALQTSGPTIPKSFEARA